MLYILSFQLLNSLFFHQRFCIDPVQLQLSCIWKLQTFFLYFQEYQLASDYTASREAFTASYWKAKQMLLLMAAYNSAKFGAVGWENYPTLGAIIETCVTGKVTLCMNSCLN